MPEQLAEAMREVPEAEQAWPCKSKEVTRLNRSWHVKVVATVLSSLNSVGLLDIIYSHCSQDSAFRSLLEELKALSPEREPPPKTPLRERDRDTI